MEQTPQSKGEWLTCLFQRVKEWLTASTQGKIFATVIALIGLRKMHDTLNRKIRKYPPGTIGAIPFISTSLRFATDEESKGSLWICSPRDYGAVSMHYAGNNAMVILNTEQAVNQVYSQLRMVHRYQLMSDDNQAQLHESLAPILGTPSLAEADGHRYWRERRERMETSLALLLNSSCLDQIIPDSLQRLNLQSGKEWMDHRAQLNQLYLTTVMRCAFGNELKIEDSEMHEFSRVVFDVVSVFGLNLMARNMGSIGGTFFAMMAGSKSKSMPAMKDTARRWVETYKSDGLAGAGQIEWFVDTLLYAFEENETSMDEAVADLAVLFSAGSHTLAAVTEQCLLFAAMNIDDQDRAREELRSVFSDTSEMTLKRLNAETPLLKALTRESLRLSPTLITALPRYNNQSDLEIEGYRIPKGATIWMNIKHLHSKTDIWGEDADSFDMDRWLNEEKQFNTELSRYLHAFGHGKRNCPGRQLGLNQLQLVMAHLLFQWRFTFVNHTPDTLKFLDFEPYQSPFSFKVSQV